MTDNLYTAEVSEMSMTELKDKLRRIHQKQERLVKESRVIESELIERASEADNASTCDPSDNHT